MGTIKSASMQFPISESTGGGRTVKMLVPLAQMSHSFRGNSRESWGAEDEVAPMSFSGIEHASAAENTCVWFCEGLMKDAITVLGEQ